MGLFVVFELLSAIPQKYYCGNNNLCQDLIISVKAVPYLGYAVIIYSFAKSFHIVNQFQEGRPSNDSKGALYAHLVLVLILVLTNAEEGAAQLAFILHPSENSFTITLISEII